MELGNVAVGAAVGGDSGAATALYGEQYNRQLHLKEAEALAEMVAGASAAEAERLRAAACALIACAQGVPAGDPHYEELVGLQQAGATYLAEQEALKGTGLFTYTRTDAANDWVLAYDEAFTRLGGAARSVGGGRRGGSHCRSRCNVTCLHNGIGMCSARWRTHTWRIKIPWVS